MHRIDDPTASPTLPAPRPPGTPGYFTGGSPGSSGFAATVVRYEWTNAVQEELAAIVAIAGLTLDKTNNNQVLQALQQMLRFKLTQDEYLYISPTGNDSSDGLTEGTALATGQAAWNKALTLDLNNHNLILQFAAGTHTTPLSFAGTPLGIGAASGVILQGDTTTPSNVVIAPPTGFSAVSASEGAAFLIRGVSVQASGVPGSYQNMGGGLVATSGGTIAFSNVNFLHCDWAHIVAGGTGQISSNGNPYTIMAGGGNHLLSFLGGYIADVNSAVSLTGTPAFTTAYATASSKGMIASYGNAFAGAATGARYYVGTGGLIMTNGAGPNYFPGNAAGTADGTTFGIYD